MSDPELVDFALANQTIAAIEFLKQSDPILAALIAQVGACQLAQQGERGDLFASLVRSILYQQISGKAADAILRRLLLLYPDQAFPSAVDILNTPEEILRSAGVSRPKIRYLKDLAQKVLDGLPSLEDLEPLDDETIIQTLTQVKGIGRWTAQMLLIFRLDRYDVLPVDDLGVRSGIRKVYSLVELPDSKTIEHLGRNWQPYRSIATWYLWRSLEID